MDSATMDSPPLSKPKPAAKNAVRKSKGSQITLAYRLAVASRILAATFGGYLVAALTSVCITQWLPMSRADAVVTGTLLSFLAYLVAVLWCFACRTAWHAWIGLAIPGAILAALFACGRWLS
jgi:predicted membrane channel-forming protein YqfA (hemolysin III family)